MHPPRCPYRGNASALRASTGVHNNTIIQHSEIQSLHAVACWREESQSMCFGTGPFIPLIAHSVEIYLFDLCFFSIKIFVLYTKGAKTKPPTVWLKICYIIKSGKNGTAKFILRQILLKQTGFCFTEHYATLIFY